MKKVNIIIPVWNLAWMTINCLKSIKASTDKNKFVVNLIDNGSKKEEWDKIQKYLENEFDCDFEIIKNETNEGFVLATNKGLRRAIESGADYAVFMNNDALVTSGWLDRFILSAKKDERVGLVGGMTSPPDWRELPIAQRFIENKVGYEQMRQSIEGYASSLRMGLAGFEDQVDFIAFYCTLVNLKMVKDIGVLDEDYIQGLFDDDDFCYRALNADWKIMLRKDVYIHHYHRSTWIAHKVDYHERLEKNREVFIKKHGFDPWDRLAHGGSRFKQGDE